MQSMHIMHFMQIMQTYKTMQIMQNMQVMQIMQGYKIMHFMQNMQTLPDLHLRGRSFGRMALVQPFQIYRAIHTTVQNSQRHPVKSRSCFRI